MDVKSFGGRATTERRGEARPGVKNGAMGVGEK
jgi:hypothetical protein